MLPMGPIPLCTAPAPVPPAPIPTPDDKVSVVWIIILCVIIVILGGFLAWAVYKYRSVQKETEDKRGVLYQDEANVRLNNEAEI